MSKLECALSEGNKLILKIKRQKSEEKKLDSFGSSFQKSVTSQFEENLFCIRRNGGGLPDDGNDLSVKIGSLFPKKQQKIHSSSVSAKIEIFRDGSLPVVEMYPR